MARLLVTGCAPPNAGLYLLDTANGEIRRFHDRPVRGITRGADGIYFVEHKGTLFHVEPESWTVTRRLDTGLQGCHDLRWIGGHFYLVASRGNHVVRYDSDLRLVDRMQIVAHEEDVCHANCLLELGGELLLSVFTLSPGTREEKRLTQAWRADGKILRLDWARKTYEVLFEPLAQPHSLVPRGGEIYCTESHTSEIHAVSLEQKRRRRVRRLYGFVRGLAFQGDRAYTGISQLKNTPPPTGLKKLLTRRRMNSGVLELDARSWRVKARYAIPGTEVYEILVLDP